MIPSAASRPSASRRGPRLTPSSLVRSASTRRWPGAYRPSLTPSVIASITASTVVARAFAAVGMPANLPGPHVADALGLELGAGECAHGNDLDDGSELAARHDLGLDPLREFVEARRVHPIVRLDLDGEHVEAAVGGPHDLELRDDMGHAPYRVLDRAGEQRDSAHVQHVVGAPEEPACGAYVRPAAHAGLVGERRVVADEEAQLGRRLGAEVGDDGHAA